MKLTKSDILAVPHLESAGFDGLKNFKVSCISIDSRTVKPGDLFVAIQGAQFDGHNFLSKAIESGASAIIVERRWADANNSMVVSIHIPLIIVDNTIHALGQLANIHRRKFKIPVIAIGGSNGKTTTKEMIRSVLGTKYKVLFTEGNLNNHIGVPQTLFRLEKKHKAAVIEIGANHPGEIKYLCTLVEPTHGLLTNIGREHLEYFGSIKGVAKSEGELFDWLVQHKGILFINADDKYIAGMSGRTKKALRFGFTSQKVDIKGTIKSFNTDAQAIIQVKTKNKKAFEITIGAPGEHNAKNALAAAAVALTLKVPPGKIKQALGSFQPADKRMQISRVANVTILNDTYNANPDSTLAALDTLKAIKTSGKKIFVFADMLELGPNAEDLHRQIGKALTQRSVDVVLTYGSLAKFSCDTASIERKSHFDNKDSLTSYLLQLLTVNDVILVKGSRGMKMEDIVIAINERLSQKTGS